MGGTTDSYRKWSRRCESVHDAEVSTSITSATTMLALLLFLISCPYCLPQATITQSSPFLILRPGDPGSLWCTVSNAGVPNMYWYRQGRQDKTLTLVSTSVSVNSVEELTLTHFTATRNTSSDFYLSTKSVAGNDSGVYYCAWSTGGGGSERQYFGSGTILTILEEGKEQKKPDVSIYRPKKRELEDNNFISLVCVASNFFPEHVKIRWFVNSEERINLYEPVPQKNADDSYSTSKRLTLTREEYFNPDTTFRCVAAFLDGTLEASEEIKGETDCGVSKEFYTMYINQGKISYIMVLCKSGLYALVVLVLVWRKKVIAHSY